MTRAEQSNVAVFSETMDYDDYDIAGIITNVTYYDGGARLGTVTTVCTG